MKYTEKLADISEEEIKSIGGKAANLCLLLRSGFLVPDGFVLLPQAFEYYLSKNKIAREINSALNSIRHSKSSTVESVSNDIIKLIKKGTIPLDLQKVIFKDYGKLSSIYVAVRSSATAEDSIKYSWAGQLDTFLNTTRNNLLDNIKSCWASLFSTRAIYYRIAKGLINEELSISVIIQIMIQSDKSGTAFSVHPITQANNHLLIEAGFGLGEAIVSGRITPDKYVVDKLEYKIIEKHINEKKQMLSLSDKGRNKWSRLPKPISIEEVMSDNDIIGLSKAVALISKVLRYPVDVEWAQKGRKQYILQARPITSLYDEKSTIRKISVKDKFKELMFGQRLFSPVHNFTLFTGLTGWTTSKYYDKYYRDRTSMPCLVICNKTSGIFYLSETKMIKLSKEFFIKFWKRPAILHEFIRQFQIDYGNIHRIYNRLTYDFIKKSSISSLAKPIIKINKLAWNLNALGWFSLFFDKDFCYRILNEIDPLAWDRISPLWETASKPIFNSFEQRKTYFFINNLFKGLGIDNIAEKGQYFYADFQKIPSLMEVKRKIQREYINKHDFKKHSLFFSKQKHIEITAACSNISSIEEKIKSYIQTIVEVRDYLRDIIGMTHTLTYRFAQKVFREARIPERYIYFCTLNELMKGITYLIQNKSRIIERENGYAVLMDHKGKTYEEYSSFKENMEYLNEYYTYQFSEELEAENLIKGQSGSSGKVQGKVKIILDLKKDRYKLKTADILVTGMTRPEFVPLMKRAAAIITDEGGITSHAAIVSRELKIPCVVGTKVATRILKDGDKVLVDGNNGIVKIVKQISIGKKD